MTRFCPRCASLLGQAPPTTCPGCGYALYVNARPTASVIILDAGERDAGEREAGERYLALRRVREPNAGKWDIPGGFCDGWEHPADAAVREAREELGVRVRLDRFVGMYLGEYRYQDELLPVLDCFWLASIVEGELAVDPAEADGFAWLPLAQPPPMAFATMDRALRDLGARLAVPPGTAGGPADLHQPAAGQDTVGAARGWPGRAGHVT